MTSPSEIESPTHHELITALDIVVSALVALRLDPPEQVRRAMALREHSSFRPVTFDSLLGTPQEVLRERDLVSAPMSHGLKSAVRELGKSLHSRLLDVDEMLAIAEKICDRDPENWGRRMSIINSAWNGIGHWLA